MMNRAEASRRGFLRGAGVAVAGLASVSKGEVGEKSHAPDRMSFNVRDYGAKGDGKTLDTPAINEAIKRAALAGGGTVIFPAGTYLCYSIRLMSNVVLDLAI